MTGTLTDPGAEVERPPPRDPWWSRLLRLVGGLLVAAGLVVGLFIVYLLYWTDLEAAQAQAELVEGWEGLVIPEAPEAELGVPELAAVPPRTEPLVEDSEDTDEQVVPVAPGDSYALLWFQRGDEFIVTDGVIGVVAGVSLDFLQRGPGHYPDSVAPGEAGNTAFAGHRTTYGKPFHNLDVLQPGDEIHVVDRAGRHWVYDFLELQVVAPTDVWVVTDDAVAGVDHLLTLTTCHPRYSAAQRLVAFAELRRDPETGEPAAGDDAGPGGDESADGSATSSEAAGRP